MGIPYTFKFRKYNQIIMVLTNYHYSNNHYDQDELEVIKIIYPNSS